ncbi:F-box protein At2g17036 [Beta vulgaris subsp. vulgaris]|uniref:F-box protein At2g17036 n=1 Tax=Beta vulgaris subsp. vulgaris TaxID=3555 RepID=UPI002547ADA9|nr:F-box protein At2g17036 [Beta vulgaris subsp. vulgaris]
MDKIPPWSDLLQELLTKIFEHLPSNSLDILSFRSVCKSWRSSSSSSSSPNPTIFPPLPLAVPCPPYYNQFRDVAVLSMTAIYALHPPNPNSIKDNTPSCWITFIDQSIREKLSIRKPFSKACYYLPRKFPRTLNLFSFHVSDLGRFYNLSYVTTPDGKLTKRCACFGMVRKVVLYKNGDEFVVLALSDEGELGLLRLRLGDGDDKLLGVMALTKSDWEIVHDGKGFHFDDFVDFKGKILAIDRRGRVYKIVVGVCSSSTVMSVISPPIVGGGGRRKRLVESLGRLYLVVRCYVRGEKDAYLKVYELNGNTNKWVEVKSLGDRTFFFGIEFSFSASKEELHSSYGKNCILFKERSFLNYNGVDDEPALFHNLAEHDLRIGVWRMDDAANVNVIGSCPGYSDLFWPPPTWILPNIKPRSKSSRRRKK